MVGKATFGSSFQEVYLRNYALEGAKFSNKSIQYSPLAMKKEKQYV